MIQQDYISKSLSLLSIALLLFLSTFGADIMLKAVFIVTIILSSYYLSRNFGLHGEDADITDVEFRESVKWSVFSLVTILILNIFVPRLPLGIMQSASALTPDSQRIVIIQLGLLIAVAEEQFFRAFGTGFLVEKFGAPAGVTLSGFVFGIYHSAVYAPPTGDWFSIFLSPSMIIVSGAGIILALAAYRTQRVSTTMSPHILNNLLAAI